MHANHAKFVYVSDCSSNSECLERTIDHSDLPELFHPQSSFLNIFSTLQVIHSHYKLKFWSPNDHFEALEDKEPELSNPTSTLDLVSCTRSESLYERSSLTVSSSSVLIMKYKMRHNLT